MLNLLKSQLVSLPKLQRNVLVYMQAKRPRSTPLFIRLNWLPIHQCIELNTCTLTFKVENNLAPEYLNHVFQKQSDIHDHCTRSCVSGCLHTTRGNGANHLKSFEYCGAKVWNSPPKSFRDIKSLDVFKSKCELCFMDIFKADTFLQTTTLVLDLNFLRFTLTRLKTSYVCLILLFTIKISYIHPYIHT